MVVNERTSELVGEGRRTSKRPAQKGICGMLDRKVGGETLYGRLVAAACCRYVRCAFVHVEDLHENRVVRISRFTMNSFKVKTEDPPTTHICLSSSSAQPALSARWVFSLPRARRRMLPPGSRHNFSAMPRACLACSRQTRQRMRPNTEKLRLRTMFQRTDDMSFAPGCHAVAFSSFSFFLSFFLLMFSFVFHSNADV